MSGFSTPDSQSRLPVKATLNLLDQQQNSNEALGLTARPHHAQVGGRGGRGRGRVAGRGRGRTAADAAAAAGDAQPAAAAPTPGEVAAAQARRKEMEALRAAIAAREKQLGLAPQAVRT